MGKNNAAAPGVDLAYPAAADDRLVEGRVGLSYLKFMIGGLVAFMLLIIGKIEAGDINNASAGRVLLLLALLSAIYALFELSRGLRGARLRANAERLD
jgi:uncharacterized membrane protein YqjE